MLKFKVSHLKCHRRGEKCKDYLKQILKGGVGIAPAIALFYMIDSCHVGRYASGHVE